jgi:hypothetical protein
MSTAAKKLVERSFTVSPFPALFFCGVVGFVRRNFVPDREVQRQIARAVAGFSARVTAEIPPGQDAGKMI